MNHALKLEDVYGLKSEGINNNHLGYFYEILNTEFVTVFMDNMPDTRKLREFVYAIDALAEIARQPGFPAGKLLNNTDIHSTPNRAAFMFHALARASRDRSLFGVTVSPHIEELINEIFDHEYLALFGKLFTATRFPYIFCVLDGVRYHITLIREFRCVPGYSAIKFVDGLTGNEVFIPFLSHRLG